MEHVKKMFANDRFIHHVGIELVDLGPGAATARLAIRPQHLNGLDIVQGGAIFTLADFAFAVAANSHGNVAVGLNCGITYIKAVRGGVLTARAREVSKNQKVATYTVDITDEQHEAVAVFQGLAYRKKERLGGEG